MNNKINFSKQKILVQSMTNVKTENVKGVIEQINNLKKVGCDLVRVAILDEKDMSALEEVIKLSPLPIIADIHFNYKFALKAIEMGVAKIRLNPGNINKPEEVLQIINLAKQKNIYIRIGVNSGSLPEYILAKYNNEIAAQAMVETLETYLVIFKENNFENIVISLKASDPLLNIEANQLAATKFNYPLHVGVTEAGPLMDAILKSAIGLTPLLQSNIVSTIRISISDDPVLEVKAAHKLLNILNLSNDRVNIISCPTCGRLSYKLFEVVNKIEQYCEDKFFPLKISILGCIVNGIGEGKHADIGIAGSNTKAFLFENGKIIKTIDASDGYDELVKLIDKHYQLFLSNKNKNQ